MPVGVSAYVPLANVTLSASAASVSFSSISQMYRDLVLVINATGTGTIYPYARFNSDSGTNYSNVMMLGNGGSTSSSAATNRTVAEFATTVYATTTSRIIITVSILDYSASDKHKTYLSRANNSGVGVEAVAGRWGSTSAISSITIFDNFAAGSTFALYGVSA